MGNQQKPWGFGGFYPSLVLLFSSLVSAQYSWGTAIPHTGWTVTADSFQTGNEAARAIDGNSSTFWHTQYTPTVAQLPHYIQVDMQRNFVVSGVSYQPRQDGSRNGNIGQHTVTVSTDGTTFSAPIQFGTYLNDATTKVTWFSNITARYVRITAQSEAQGQANQWTSIAEINIYSPNTALTSYTPPPTSQGRWDQTVVFPIVPAAGALSVNGDLIFWSAYRPDLFGSGTGFTLTSSWTPSTQTVTQRNITNTQHDMFCPGISLDANGRIFVTGGNDNKKASIYDPASAGWVAGAQMIKGRGYQSTVTIGDGRIFTIGGSWSGGEGGKNGEIYTPSTNTWKALPGAVVAPMLTADAQGVYRADNHAWLFAYKANTVFQAGPSRAMNWYNATGAGGNGTFTAAGTRALDGDSMCGNAVMYDATNGLILSAGGSPSYQNSAATSNTHIIQLGNVNAAPTVTKVPNMRFARAFANGVVLPDGKVFIVGGQSTPVPFTDTTPAFPAELFDPATRTWSTMASIAVPRTYHSVALLLPDATVLAGGGGLCGTGCVQNHFDVQIFSPPYLFNGDGTRATRPTIASVSTAQAAPGATLTVTTGSAVSSFSLVRYGSTTHTVNTDQRRVPLTPTATNGLSYTLALPTDPGVLVPGYWLLFAINSAGVPSVATTIKVVLS